MNVWINVIIQEQRRCNMSKEIMNTTEELSSLYNNVASLIKTTKDKVYHSLNTELVLLYWNIGKTIKEDIIKVERAGYGEKIVADLAKELSEQYIARVIFLEWFSSMKLFPKMK